ncbi:N-acetylglucosaminidase [Ammoniphilus sp. YIM 78166]|uniref:N-acetylglucosaminidase n=1 Tax=Ammoniphilus sp. YIM 78166 TaxID=1644106 RepID=UPI00106F6B9B|nr:glucosaminidase domain-containing protein [Ammoniphilus sp. YIM 78166]
MHQKSLVTLMTALLTFVIFIQNPYFAVLGQASPYDDSEEFVEQPALKVMTIEEPVITPDPIEEAREEKQSLDNTTASILYQTIKESEEIHREFVKEVRTTDVTRLDLRKPSGLDKETADALLEGTGLEGLGKAFVETEERYQVNAYYLIAHAAWESGWGKSRISKEKNNLFGFAAYDKSPYHSAKGFRSKEEGIDVVAKYVQEHYLNPNGRFFNGPHLKGMNVRYATDENWQRGIAKVMTGLANKATEYKKG